MAVSPVESEPEVQKQRTPGLLEALTNKTASSRLVGEELIALAEPLAELLGTAGLRKGSSLSLVGARSSGVFSLALSLLIEASTQGRWCAVVDLPELGYLAGFELGVALDHLVVVPSSKGRPGVVLSSLLEGFDIVLAGEPVLSKGEVRRLVAKTRERRSVLVVVSPVLTRGGVGFWPEAPDAQFVVKGGEFVGLGKGSGRLLGHRLELEVTRRRAAPEKISASLWLPAPEGGISSEGATPLPGRFRALGVAPS